jgi:hypothetical protein
MSPGPQFCRGRIHASQRHETEEQKEKPATLGKEQSSKALKMRQPHQPRQENPPGGQIGQELVIGTDNITGAAGKLLSRDAGADDLIIPDKLVSGSPQAAAKKGPDNLFPSDHCCLFAGGRHPINVKRFAFWEKS